MGRIIEISGAGVLTYADMMREYARVRGLRRLLLPVSVLSSGLPSHWVHWMTPLSSAIARLLVEGLRNELVVREPAAHTLFPQIQPLDYAIAVTLALARIEKGAVETIWSDALASSQGDLLLVYLTQEQGMLIERRQKRVNATPAHG